MHFLIDIIWLPADKKVVFRQLNAEPSTYPQTFRSNKPARYVLELAAGRAAKLGFTKDSSFNFR